MLHNRRYIGEFQYRDVVVPDGIPAIVPQDLFDRVQEKLAKPKVSAEFMTFWLHRFRKLDVRQKSHRKMLIDTFINAIFLYDDKLVLTFNYKEGAKTITFADLQDVMKHKSGSDLDCSAAPLRNRLLTSGRHARVVSFDGKACFFVQNRDRFAGSRFCFRRKIPFPHSDPRHAVGLRFCLF